MIEPAWLCVGTQTQGKTTCCCEHVPPLPDLYTMGLSEARGVTPRLVAPRDISSLGARLTAGALLSEPWLSDWDHRTPAVWPSVLGNLPVVSLYPLAGTRGRASCSNLYLHTQTRCSLWFAALSYHLWHPSLGRELQPRLLTAATPRDLTHRRLLKMKSPAPRLPSPLTWRQRAGIHRSIQNSPPHRIRALRKCFLQKLNFYH